MKNRLADKAYESEFEEEGETQYRAAKAEELKMGQRVYVTNLKQEGTIQSVRPQKGEAEILCGNVRIHSKISDLAVVISAPTAQAKPKPKHSKWQKQNANEKVQIKKTLNPKPLPTMELNVIGLTVAEALPEVEAFIDAAVIANLEEVRIVHGVGTGKLRAGVHDFLRGHRNVAEYRLGKYGEGETGVTIVKIR